MSSDKTCPNCGAILGSEAEDSLCPACMLQRAFSPTQSEVLQEQDPMGLTQTYAPGILKTPEQPDSGSAGNSEQPEFEAGTVYGDYQIIQRLGRGGMGTVYEADHAPTGRRVALKVLSHSLDNPEARARFLREGRLAASINHPNSVYVFGTENIDGTPTISMELIAGGTLQQKVRDSGPMSVQAAVDAVLQVIDGLEAADRKGVLHRDVKPANCFVDTGGVIKIGDFGLSISTGPRDAHEMTNVTREGTFLGTPAFASPEQLRGEALDRGSDIYSVGVTLFYLLTGEAPFKGENMIQLLATVLDKPAPSVRSVRDDVPESLQRVVSQCLQKASGNRFTSYESLRAALLPLSSRRAVPAAIGTRFLAGAVDTGIHSVVFTLVSLALSLDFTFRHPSLVQIGRSLTLCACIIAYYAICERRWGATIGKWLFRIRVTAGGNPITTDQAIKRAAIFVFVPWIPLLVFGFVNREMTVGQFQKPSLVAFIAVAVGWSYYVIRGAMFLTAKRVNGNATVYDLISGTRVVNYQAGSVQMMDCPLTDRFDGADQGKLGGYHILQTLREVEGDRLLLAYDAQLLRRVWLHVTPIGFPHVSSDSRNLTRPTRLRWLGARRSEDESWDCYEAPTGSSFQAALHSSDNPDLLFSALSDLCQELILTEADGTTPKALAMDRLWVTSEGRIKLLPFDAPGDVGSSDEPPSETETASVDSGAANSVELVKHVSAAILHGTHKNQLQLAGPKSISLTHRRLLGRIAESNSLQNARQDVVSLAHMPTPNVRHRVIGMLAAMFFLPLFVIGSSLSFQLIFDRQSRNEPRLHELGRWGNLLNQQINSPSVFASVDSLKSQQQTYMRSRVEAHSDFSHRYDRPIEILEQELIVKEAEDAGANLTQSLKIWIGSEYGDLIEDKEKMNSALGIIQVGFPLRTNLEEAVVVAADASDEEIEKARPIAKALMSRYGHAIPGVNFSITSSFNLLFPVVSWIEFFWLPSVITGLLFGGGLIMRLFGLALVNRHGQRASRPRVFLRMLISGAVPVSLLVLCLVIQGHPASPDAMFGIDLERHEVPLLIVAGVVLLVIGKLSINRFISDRLAGTYFVAR